MNINKYNKKRNFNKTKEPYGIIKIKNNKKLKFVIQLHYARKKHYDLRLEYNGVYKSFAVPNGPSYNPKDKRLAIKVEDHPLSYGNFEGTIPKGQYGGGTVMIIDKGYIDYETKPNFSKGPIKFTLKGKFLKGSWSLIPFKDNNYLLIKEKDKYVNYLNISKLNTSIKTNRTIEEISQNIENITLTNPNKIIYPKNKITKEDIYNYYKKISNYIMPYLENRLISTVRSPSGIENEKFFMKHIPKNKNIGKKLVKEKIKTNDYYYFKNISGLLSEVQNNSYEFHIWSSKQNKINKPDILIFDLDPDKDLSLAKVRQGVKELKEILDNLNLKSYLKTSGNKGYHIYIPISSTSWAKVKTIAKNISEILVNKSPNKYTTNLSKNKRKNKIFIDYYRNQKGATSVCPYSLRLKEKASISCPISWEDLNKIKPNQITIKNIDKYLKKDPWKDFFN